MHLGWYCGDGNADEPFCLPATIGIFRFVPRCKQSLLGDPGDTQNVCLLGLPEFVQADRGFFPSQTVLRHNQAHRAGGNLPCVFRPAVTDIPHLPLPGLLISHRIAIAVGFLHPGVFEPWPDYRIARVLPRLVHSASNAAEFVNDIIIQEKLLETRLKNYRTGTFS